MAARESTQLLISVVWSRIQTIDSLKDIKSWLFNWEQHLSKENQKRQPLC